MVVTWEHGSLKWNGWKAQHSLSPHTKLDRPLSIQWCLGKGNFTVVNSWTNIQTTGQTLTTTSAHTSHTSEQREEKEGGQTKADTPAVTLNGLLDSGSSQLHQQVLTGDQFHGRCICGSGLPHPISSLLAQLHCGPETMLHRLLSEVTLEDQTFSCHAEPT